MALCRCHDQFGGATRPTLATACYDEMQNNPPFQLTPEQEQTLFSEDPADPGVIKYVFDLPDTQIGPDTDRMAEDVLQRFLLERVVAAPLRRAATASFTDPTNYLTGLFTVLDTAQEQRHRITDALTQHRWKTARQLLRLRRWRVELCRNVLAARQLGLLGGTSKAMKTHLALDLAISLATATCWLGHPHFACPVPQRLGFISCESGDNTLGQVACLMLHQRMRAEPECADRSSACSTKTCDSTTC